MNWVPHGVEVDCWLSNPRASVSIPCTCNLEKLFIWMKIHGLTQKQTVKTVPVNFIVDTVLIQYCVYYENYLNSL